MTKIDIYKLIAAAVSYSTLGLIIYYLGWVGIPIFIWIWGLSTITTTIFTKPKIFYGWIIKESTNK